MNGTGCRGPGVVVIAASMLALSGCSVMIPIAGPTTQAGPTTSEEAMDSPGSMTSEQREIGDVSRVVLDTSGDLVVSEGEPTLTVHAPEDVIEGLTSEDDGGTLVLSAEPGFTMSSGEIRYELTVPNLELIDVNGSGDVEATVSTARAVQLDLDGSGDVGWSGLAADRVDVLNSGSGDVALTGTATELSIELEGSGAVDAEQLQVEDAVVTLSGSGDIAVAASVSLSVDLSGSGHVTYSGDPGTEVRVSGSGEVERR